MGTKSDIIGVTKCTSPRETPKSEGCERPGRARAPGVSEGSKTFAGGMRWHWPPGAALGDSNQGTNSAALPPCGRRPLRRGQPAGRAAEGGLLGAARTARRNARPGRSPQGRGPGRGAPPPITWVSNRPQPMGARGRWCASSPPSALGRGRAWSRSVGPPGLRGADTEQRARLPVGEP